MEKEIRNEVKSLLKIGLPENLAIITACANKGKPELAEQYLEELNDDQQEIQSFLKHLIPITEAIKLQEEAKGLNGPTGPSEPSVQTNNNEMTLTEN